MVPCPSDKLLQATSHKWVTVRTHATASTKEPLACITNSPLKFLNILCTSHSEHTQWSWTKWAHSSSLKPGSKASLLTRNLIVYLQLLAFSKQPCVFTSITLTPRKSHPLADVLKKIHWCAPANASSIELCVYKSDMGKIPPPSMHILEAKSSIIGDYR